MDARGHELTIDVTVQICRAGNDLASYIHVASVIIIVMPTCGIGTYTTKGGEWTVKWEEGGYSPRKLI